MLRCNNEFKKHPYADVCDDVAEHLSLFVERVKLREETIKTMFDKMQLSGDIVERREETFNRMKYYESRQESLEKFLKEIYNMKIPSQQEKDSLRAEFEKDLPYYSENRLLKTMDYNKASLIHEWRQLSSYYSQEQANRVREARAAILKTNCDFEIFNFIQQKQRELAKNQQKLDPRQTSNEVAVLEQELEDEKTARKWGAMGY